MKFVSAIKLYRKSGVRFGERGAPVRFPHKSDVGQANDNRQSSGRVPWYPTSREKRARCGAPVGCVGRELYSDLVVELDGDGAGALSVLAAGALSAVPPLSEVVELPSELLPPSCDLPEEAGLAA